MTTLLGTFPISTMATLATESMDHNVVMTPDTKLSNDLQLVKTCGEQTQGVMPIAAKEFTIFSKLPSEIQLNIVSVTIDPSLHLLKAFSLLQLK